jgi:preprotein translocase subunit YajC
LVLALQTLAPTPSEATTSAPAHAPEPAGQAAPSGGGLLGSPLFFLVLFVPLIAMMFWSSRSQQKKQEKALTELKKGDLVLTQGGLRGRLVEMGDRFAKIEIAPGTKIEVLKSAVLGKDGTETAAQLEKK